MKFIIGTIVGVILSAGAVWYFMGGGIHMGMMGMGNMMSDQTAEYGTSLTELPHGHVDTVKPTEIVELKDGDTFALEATIVSQEVGNRTVKRLAYNGQIPGPVLKVQKGSKIVINFTNNIDMETALHSHGLRGNWLFDGAVPLTPPVLVGETFSYELEFPDTGVFWYHPHVREDYQQEMGLYGNFIVEEAGYWNDVAQEEYLIVDDILEDGEFYDGAVTNTLMGRFGDTLLINDSRDYNLTVKAGEISRLFITNVANTRTFDLEFSGAEMKLVGGDIGRNEKEEIITHQIIAPAERYIVEVLYQKAGTYSIVHRGKTMGSVTVEESSSDNKLAFSELRNNGADYVEIRNDITALLAKTPDKNLRLTIEMKGGMNDMMMGGDHAEEANGEHDRMHEHCRMMPEMSGCEELLAEPDGEVHDEEGEVEHSSDGIEWEDEMAMMNSMSNDETIEWVIEDVDTGQKNADIDWSFAVGDLVKITVNNDENSMHPMQHPLHFHGQRFVVLTEDGVLNDNMQWKDTVLIPKGQKIEILVDMSNAGKWMAHCHIAEHLHSGMMFNFEVK